jgi:hypothetical protein
MDISRSYYFCTHEQGCVSDYSSMSDATIVVHMNTGVFQLTVAFYVRNTRALIKIVQVHILILFFACSNTSAYYYIK